MMSTLTHGRRGIWLAALLTAAVALAAVLIAGGISRGAASGGTDSFSGTCSTQGTVTFSPPIKFQPQQLLTVVYTATGTCSGTLDGKSISNMPVKLQHSGQADASCAHAQTTGPGTGNIYFQNGIVIPYTFTFQDVLSEIAFTYSGQQSGSAHGHGSFATPRTTQDDLNGCNDGKGAKAIPMDMEFLTESAFVSKRKGGGGGKTGGSTTQHTAVRSEHHRAR